MNALYPAALVAVCAFVIHPCSAQQSAVPEPTKFAMSIALPIQIAACERRLPGSIPSSSMLVSRWLKTHQAQIEAQEREEHAKARAAGEFLRVDLIAEITRQQWNSVPIEMLAENCERLRGELQ